MPYIFKEFKEGNEDLSKVLSDVWLYWNSKFEFDKDVNEGLCPLCDTSTTDNLFCTSCRSDYSHWLETQPNKAKGIVNFMRHRWRKTNRRTLDKWLAGE